MISSLQLIDCLPLECWVIFAAILSHQCLECTGMEATDSIGVELPGLGFSQPWGILKGQSPHGAALCHLSTPQQDPQGHYLPSFSWK